MIGLPTRVELSDRDLDLLRFLFQVGIADASQLQRFGFPPGPGSEITAARRARRTLDRLVKHGMITRLDRRLGGVRAGSSGYLYQLGSTGRRVLGIRGRGRSSEPGARFIDHTLAATELHVQLIEAQRQGGLKALAIGHERETLRRFATPSGIERLRPDLLVEVTTAGGWELRWFVEIDRGTEHLPTVLRKCQTYERYWRSGGETQHHDVFPRVLWSVPTERRAKAIEKAIASARGLTTDLYRVATAAETAHVITTNDNPEGGQP